MKASYEIDSRVYTGNDSNSSRDSNAAHFAGWTCSVSIKPKLSRIFGAIPSVLVRKLV